QVEPFNANLSFTKEGALELASLSGASGWNLALKPAEKGMSLDFSARNWTLPVGAPIPVSSVQMKGTLDSKELVVPEFEASAMEGKVNGTLRASWSPGLVHLESELSLSHLLADQFMSTFTRNIAITGKLDGNFNFVAEAPNAEQLFTAPVAKGKFKLTEGS